MDRPQDGTNSGWKLLKYTPYVYNTTKIIGEGGYGIVYLGVNMKDKTKVIAIKVVLKPEKLKEIEVNNVSIIPRSVNLVRYEQYCLKSSNKHYFVMEYCKGEILDFLGQILNGIAELLNKDILLGDLKPGNILIHEGYYKIVDFGDCISISKQQRGEERYYSHEVGTAIYKAPESLKFKGIYQSQSDVFSLGVILLNLMYSHANLVMFSTYEPNGVHPYISLAGRDFSDKKKAAAEITRLKNEVKSLTEEESMKYFNDYLQKQKIKRNPFLIDLLKKMLEHDPKKRISFPEMFKIPIFSQYIQTNLMKEHSELFQTYNNVFQAPPSGIMGEESKITNISEINWYHSFSFIKNKVCHYTDLNNSFVGVWNASQVYGQQSSIQEFIMRKKFNYANLYQSKFDTGSSVVVVNSNGSKHEEQALTDTDKQEFLKQIESEESEQCQEACFEDLKSILEFWQECNLFIRTTGEQLACQLQFIEKTYRNTDSEYVKLHEDVTFMILSKYEFQQEELSNKKLEDLFCEATFWKEQLPDYEELFNKDVLMNFLNSNSFKEFTEMIKEHKNTFQKSLGELLKSSKNSIRDSFQNFQYLYKNVKSQIITNLINSINRLIKLAWTKAEKSKTTVSDEENLQNYRIILLLNEVQQISNNKKQYEQSYHYSRSNLVKNLEEIEMDSDPRSTVCEKLNELLSPFIYC